MKNEDYVAQVNAGEFPKAIKVPLDAPFEDARGIIQNLWLGNSGSVTLITSKAGSVRANHKHKNDWHAIYVVSGLLSYQLAHHDGEIEEITAKSGEMIFTPPDIHHTVVAIEDTTFLTINGIVKNHENYMKTMYKN